MATMGFADVVSELQKNNNLSTETNKSVQDLTTVFKDYIQADKNRRLDELEARRKQKGDGKDGTVAGISSAIQQNKDDAASLGIPLLGLQIGAIVAWSMDFDAFLRALHPPTLLKPIKTFFNATADAFRGVTKTIDSILSIDLKPFLTSLDNLQLKIRVDLLDYTDRFEKAIDGISDFFKGIANLEAPKLPEAISTRLTAVKNFFTSITDIQLPELPEGVKKFFESAKGFFSSIGDIGAKFVSYLPDWSSITNAIGSFGGAGGEAKGILGFIGKLGGFVSTILGPIKPVLRILGGPITAGIFTLLDFIQGFAKGFFGQGEKYDEFGDVIEDDRSMFKKITDGIQGGIMGIIFGITDALSMLFFKIPGWIAEQLGFEKTAKFLKDIDLTKFLKDTIEFINSMIPSVDEIKNRAVKTIASLPGGETLLGTMGYNEAEIEAVKSGESITDVQKRLQDEATAERLAAAPERIETLEKRREKVLEALKYNSERLKEDPLSNRLKGRVAEETAKLIAIGNELSELQRLKMEFGTEGLQRSLNLNTDASTIQTAMSIFQPNVRPNPFDNYTYKGEVYANFN